MPINKKSFSKVNPMTMDELKVVNVSHKNQKFAQLTTALNLQPIGIFNFKSTKTIITNKCNHFKPQHIQNNNKNSVDSLLTNSYAHVPLGKELQGFTVPTKHC
jgi:hypothetical protein